MQTLFAVSADINSHLQTHMRKHMNACVCVCTNINRECENYRNNRKKLNFVFVCGLVISKRERERVGEKVRLPCSKLHL